MPVVAAVGARIIAAVGVVCSSPVLVAAAREASFGIAAVAAHAHQARMVGALGNDCAAAASPAIDGHSIGGADGADVSSRIESGRGTGFGRDAGRLAGLVVIHTSAVTAIHGVSSCGLRKTLASRRAHRSLARSCIRGSFAGESVGAAFGSGGVVGSSAYVRAAGG